MTNPYYDMKTYYNDILSAYHKARDAGLSIVTVNGIPISAGRANRIICHLHNKMVRHGAN